MEQKSGVSGFGEASSIFARATSRVEFSGLDKAIHLSSLAAPMAFVLGEAAEPACPPPISSIFNSA